MLFGRKKKKKLEVANELIKTQADILEIIKSQNQAIESLQKYVELLQKLILEKD